MKKVILTRGLPACGKSTWCRTEMEAHPGQYKRITKDLLREMSDCGHYTRGSEKHIIALRNLLLLYWLEQGFSVLIDDTNFNEIHERDIRELVKGKATVSIQDFTQVPLEECIERDRKRPNSVGEREIRKMHRMYLWKSTPTPAYDPDVPIALVYDLDGTVALFAHHRGPYDASTCEEDLLNEPVVSVIRSFLGTGIHFLAVSGRQEKEREPTERWLKRSGLPYDALLMRQTDDSRRDVVVKRELYEQHIKDHYTVHLVLDDRTQVVEMWRSLGLPCFQVADGDF